MAATTCSSDESASTISGLGFYASFKGSKGRVWKYFNFELDENGRLVDPNRVVCLLCAPRYKNRMWSNEYRYIVLIC